MPLICSHKKLKNPCAEQVALPTRVGLSEDITRLSFGAYSAIGVPRGSLQTFSWVKFSAQCPTACGQATVDLPDTYKCQRDGLQVPQRFCHTNLGDVPDTVTVCPPTNDCDCVGSWSACTSICGDKTFTITTPKSGVLGNGLACEAADGDRMPCVSGEGECFPYMNTSFDIDCRGEYPTCGEDCRRVVYNITRPRSGIGRPCPYPGTSKPCFPGKGNCAADVDCIGAWTGFDRSCSRTFIVTTPQSKEQVQMVVPEGALPGARCVTRLPTRVRVACDRTGLLGGPAGTSSSSSGS